MARNTYEIKLLRQSARIRDMNANAPCALCREPINYDLDYPDPACWSLDHIHAVSNGGEHTLSNSIATHLLCNQSRGNKSFTYGMFTGKRPQAGERTYAPQAIVRGSRRDSAIWTDEDTPVDEHTIHPETRCSMCPCHRSRWWLGTYQDALVQANRELEAFQRAGVRLS